MEYPVVSVIIVNYHGGKLLTDCVRAVLASTIPVVVYLIDNASTDNSLSYLQENLREEVRLHIIRNSKNLGFACAANLVLSHTTGKYLLFLNPDCLIHPNTLERFVETMENYPHAGMAGGLVRNADGTEQASCRRAIPTPLRVIGHLLYLDKFFPNRFQNFVFVHQPLPPHPIKIEGISGACMFVRERALREVGPMDEGYFLHCEDLDWFMRFHALKWDILFIPEIEITHIKGVCSHRHPIRVLWYKHRGMIRFYQKFFRHQYPLWLFWGVVIAVWVRFFFLSLFIWIRPRRH